MRAIHFGQRKLHQQLTGVLGQPPVTSLAMPELTLNHPKRLFHLGADAGFDFFNLIGQGVAEFGLLQRFALALHHGNFTVHDSVFVLNLLALFNASVARFSKDHFFLPMPQDMRMRHIASIGRRCRDRMHQARVSVKANVCLHSKLPLAALLDLVHFRAVLAFFIVGRTGRCDHGGTLHRAGLEPQLAINQLGILSGQNLRTKAVLPEHISKAQDGVLVGQLGDY